MIDWPCWGKRMSCGDSMQSLTRTSERQLKWSATFYLHFNQFWRESCRHLLLRVEKFHLQAWGWSVRGTVGALHQKYSCHGHNQIAGEGMADMGDSVLGLGPRVPGSIPSSQQPHWVRIPMLNKRGPPAELPSLWGTRVQAESLLMVHPGIGWFKYSVGNYCTTPDCCLVMKIRRPILAHGHPSDRWILLSLRRNAYEVPWIEVMVKCIITTDRMKQPQNQENKCNRRLWFCLFHWIKPL